jgi:hypothetical protein
MLMAPWHLAAAGGTQDLVDRLIGDDRGARAALSWDANRQLSLQCERRRNLLLYELGECATLGVGTADDFVEDQLPREPVVFALPETVRLCLSAAWRRAC